MGSGGAKAAAGGEGVSYYTGARVPHGAGRGPPSRCGLGGTVGGVHGRPHAAQQTVQQRVARRGRAHRGGAGGGRGLRVSPVGGVLVPALPREFLWQASGYCSPGRGTSDSVATVSRVIPNSKPKKAGWMRGYLGSERGQWRWHFPGWGRGLQQLRHLMLCVPEKLRDVLRQTNTVKQTVELSNCRTNGTK